MDTLKALHDWDTFLRAGYADSTRNYYLRIAHRFFRESNCTLSDARETDCARWLEQFPFRSSRRRTYYNALLCLFKWAIRNGYVERNPLEGIRVPAPYEKVPRALSIEDYRLVEAAAFARHPMRGYATMLLYYSGCRVGEATNLTWDDVTDDGLVLRVTKTGHERMIPWSDGLRQAVLGLKQWFGEDRRILPRSKQIVWEWVNQAGIAAGVPHVHPHLFRSTSATRMLKLGARPHAVKDVLGHAKIQTTMRYWAVEDEDKQEAVALLDEGTTADVLTMPDTAAG